MSSMRSDLQVKMLNVKSDLLSSGYAEISNKPQTGEWASALHDKHSPEVC